MLSLSNGVSDPHDVYLHQVRQAEEEEEWRQKARRKRERFPGVGPWLLLDSTPVDHDQQRHEPGSRRDTTAHGSAAELLAQTLVKTIIELRSLCLLTVEILHPDAIGDVKTVFNKDRP